MTLASSPVYLSLRLLTVAATLIFSHAHADEYADVTQLMRAGKLSDAMNKADMFLANKPRDPQMRFLKGVAQRDAGRTADAISTFTKLTEEFPELPEPYNNLAVLYASQSQFDKARSALEMAIRTNPSYATAHENLGDVYSKLASQAYNKALQLDNTNTGAAPKLAMIRELFNTPGGKAQRPAASPSGPTVAVAIAPPTPGPSPAAPTPAPVAVAKPAAAPVASATPAAPTPAVAVVAKPTPPAAAPSTPAAPASRGEVKEAEAAVYAWGNAWASKDIKNYLAAYGKEFEVPGGVSRASWEDDRRQRILGKASISLAVNNLVVTVNGNKATAKFRQEYKAAGLSVSSRKTLELVKTGERWQIVRESTGS